MFARTADQNYMIARWCAMCKQHTDFLWNSVHALEKYMKAVLLMNGQHGKGGHDIEKLYERVASLAPTLLPAVLQKSPTLDIYHWSDRTPAKFIEQLYNNGNAANRYLTFGYTVESQDLHMLDAMVFAVRRLIIRLNDPHFSDPTAPKFTSRQFLENKPTYYPKLGLPLDQQVNAREPSELRHAALNLNMPFAPADYPHTALSGGASGRNSVLMRRVLDALDSDDMEYATLGVALADWVLQNIQLPKGSPSVTEQITRARDQAKAKHNIP